VLRTTEVVANTVQFLGPPKGAAAAGSGGRPPRPSNEGGDPGYDAPNAPPPDDDIPF
jgi:single-stranded DNA-binding protein